MDCEVRGVNASPRCSVQALPESLAGTAPFAEGWLLIRSDGAWGSHAVNQAVPPETIAWATQHSYKIVLVRQHSSRHRSDAIQYWLSQGNDRLVTGWLNSLADIPDPEQAIAADPMLVVCTNGARDQCCAIEGVALRKSLDSELLDGERENVWEGTHIGGHRFAPTCLYLPGNLVLGRLSVGAALGLIRQSDIPLHNVRGRSHLSPCHQVLEVNVADYWSIQWEDLEEACPETRHTHRGDLNGVQRDFQIDSHIGGGRPESCGVDPSLPRILSFAADL